jgi:hypothetical protein
MLPSIFTLESLLHIFYGRLYDKREAHQAKPLTYASGIHHVNGNVVAAKYVRVVEGSCSKPDQHGVLKSYVELKRAGLCRVKATQLFPREWSRQQVLEAIRDVYMTRPLHHPGRTWRGRSSTGIYIFMRLDQDDKIVTAWPRKERRKKISPCKLRHSRAWRTRLYARDGLSYGSL